MNVGCTSVGSTSSSNTSFQILSGGPPAPARPRPAAARARVAASVCGVTGVPSARESASKNGSRRQGGVRSTVCSPQVSVTVPSSARASSAKSASVSSMRSV